MKFIVAFEESENKFEYRDLYDVNDYKSLIEQIRSLFSVQVEIRELFYEDYEGEKISIEENDDVIAMKNYYLENDLNIITIVAVIADMNEMKQYLNKKASSPLTPIQNEIKTILNNNNKKIMDDIMKLINDKFFKKQLMTCYKCSNCKELIYGKVYHCESCSDYFLCESCIDLNIKQRFHNDNFILKIKES